MVAPDTWTAPTSGGSVSSTVASFHNVYHAGDYWFSVARTTDTTIYLRYASDPTAAWSTATLPSWPSGVTIITPVDSGGVQYDGTHYAFALSMGTASRIYYATDPSGTWTEHQFDATGKYRPDAFLHDGSRWIIAGRWTDTSAYPNPAFVAYTGAGSAVTSTYTFGTSTAATGYDVADLGGSGTRHWTITALAYNGTQYVAAATRTPTSGVNGHLRYCTDITAASWGTPTTTQIEQASDIGYANGYWFSDGPNPTPYYSTTGTGAWTAVGTATTTLDSELLGLDYGNGYWVGAGRQFIAPASNPRLAYLQATAPDAATWTTVGTASMDFTDSTGDVLSDVSYYAGYWVAAASYNCELNWAGAPLVTATRFLRQRQSPRRSPSRIGWY